MICHAATSGIFIHVSRLILKPRDTYVAHMVVLEGTNFLDGRLYIFLHLELHTSCYM